MPIPTSPTGILDCGDLVPRIVREAHNVTNGYSTGRVVASEPEIHLADQGLVCPSSVTSKTTRNLVIPSSKRHM